MQIRCKCHGMSGSCQLKTCWKSAPEFRIVGKVLKHLFKKAILVDQSNIGNGEPLIPVRKSMRKNNHYSLNDARKKHHKNRMLRKHKLEESLLYYERSPNFCDRDIGSDVQG